MYFGEKKPFKIGFINGKTSQPTAEKAMTILDLLDTMNKHYLKELINGIKVYSYNVIDEVDKFLKDAGCCVVSTAIPNINEEYGACFFAYQWPNEITMRTLSFTYKY